MSTSPNLPAGQDTITTINGKRCTAVRRADAPAATTAVGGGGGGGGGSVGQGGGSTATSTALKQTQAPSPVVEETKTTASSPPAQVIPSSAPQSLAPETTSIPVPIAAPEQISTTEEPQAPSVVPPPVVPVQTTSQTTTPDAVILPSSITTSEIAPTTFATSTSPVLALPIVLNTSDAVSSETKSELAPSITESAAPNEPTSTISPGTTRGVALSDTQPSTTPSPISRNDESFGSKVVPSGTTATPSPSGSSPGSSAEQKSTATGLSSNSRTNMTPVIGGIFAGLALVGIVGLLLWCCRRRRRRRRNSLLTPLGPPPGEKTYYEIDNMSVGPSPRGVRLKADLGYQASIFKARVLGIGASLRSKIAPERSNSPSVNLNRGNSQFLDGPVSQHSRNNSAISYDPQLTVKDRFENWWDQFRANLAFKRQLRSRSEQDPFADPIANARGMTEKQAPREGTPDFSRLLDNDDQFQKVQAKRRSASISNLGSLGLNFQSNDPFADPKSTSKAWTPSNGNNTDSLADPISLPQPSISKGQSYIADIRRSRGQSIDATASRYPSTIAPSRDSYRDTVFSSFTTTTRKGKGRSDPFDLERPDLWKPVEKQPPVPVDSRTSTRPKLANARSGSVDYDSAMYVDPLRMSSVQPRNTGVRRPLSTVSSKYSSGVSSLGGLGDWGDPGPDLGPGSGASSMRGNPSNNSSMQFGANGVYVNGSLAELVLRREKDSVSPLSIESKGKGVGKAM